MESFKHFKLNRQLLDAVADMGYSAPTAIQQKAIPAILGGQDVLGIAQTDGENGGLSIALAACFELCTGEGCQSFDYCSHP